MANHFTAAIFSAYVTSISPLFMSLITFHFYHVLVIASYYFNKINSFFSNSFWISIGCWKSYQRKACYKNFQSCSNLRLLIRPNQTLLFFLFLKIKIEFIKISRLVAAGTSPFEISLYWFIFAYCLREWRPLNFVMC